MGSWRKIAVDDLLPISRSHHVLLPKLASYVPQPHSAPSTPTAKRGKEVLENLDVVKKEVEVWPFILSKALLKLACLSWSESNEICDFSVIQCLTGWFEQRVYTKGKTTVNSLYNLY